MDLNTTNAEPSAVGQTVPGSWTVTSIVWLLVGVTTYILFNIGLTRKTKSQFPSVGLRAEFLSRIRVTIRNIREAEGLKNHLNEGYQKFTKRGKAFVLPCWLNGDTLIVPIEHANAIGNAPDTELNPYPVVDEYLQEDYTLSIRPNEAILVETIRKHLTGKRLEEMLPTLQDEVELSIDETWGTNCDEWTPVKPWPTTIQIASRSLNRVASGLPLCRNPVYISSLVSYMHDVLINALIIKAFPRIMRPIVAPFVTRKMNTNLNNLSKLVNPVVEERCQQIKKKIENPSIEWEAPNDFITWHIEASYRHKNAYERQPHVIGERLNLLNLLAGHTSPAALSNFCIEFFSLPGTEHIEALREEIERVFAECNGKWTPTAISKLVRVDSALKESFRLHPMGLKVVERMVMKNEGFKLGDMTVPKGTVVAVPNYNVHTDDEIYPDGDKYDPFRYSRPLEDMFMASNSHALRTTQAATPSPEFLHFGYGRHACPGRFVAITLLKIDIAYILMKYDVQPFEKPKTLFRNMALLPHVKFSLNVRRRL